MGAFGFPGNRSLIESAPKPYDAFPHPSDAIHIDFDQDWPTGLKFENMDRWWLMKTEASLYLQAHQVMS